MGVHSKRGPSKAKMFRACAGCFAMADSVPKELRIGHGDAARLGTATHALIEHCLKHGKSPADLRDRIILLIEREDVDGASILKPGAKLPKAGADEYVYIVDQDMIDDADVAVEYVRGRCEVLGVSEDKLQLETRTNPLPHRDDTSGTADITIPAWPDLLEVDDYKNGWLLVEAVDNDQARAYLTGKAIEWDWDFARYAAGIIQPNSPHADGPIRVLEYTREELQQFAIEYEADIKRGEVAEEKFKEIGTEIEGANYTFEMWAAEYLKAGDHCTFCPAGATCPARRAEAQRQAAIDFDDEPHEIQLPTVPDSKLPMAGSPEEQVARILAWAPFLDDLVKAAKLYAHKAMENGYVIPGQKLVRARTNRRLKEGTTPDEIAKQTGIPKAELFWPPELKSGPQIEKMLPKGAKRKKFADTFLFKPEGGTSVVPVDDPRPAVTPRAIGDEFDDPEEDFDFG